MKKRRKEIDRSALAGFHPRQLLLCPSLLLLAFSTAAALCSAACWLVYSLFVAAVVTDANWELKNIKITDVPSKLGQRGKKKKKKREQWKCCSRGGISTSCRNKNRQLLKMSFFRFGKNNMRTFEVIKRGIQCRIEGDKGRRRTTGEESNSIHFIYCLIEYMPTWTGYLALLHSTDKQTHDTVLSLCIQMTTVS